MSKTGGLREIAVPASVFESLRGELQKEVGATQTVRALHYAGYHAGLSAAATMDAESNGRTRSLSERGFWDRLESYFSSRGWGNLGHRSAHPGVGMLSSPDWAESDRDELDAAGSCSFSAGFLSGVLTKVAGGPIAVLEVGCRSRGASRCDFAFGSETAIQQLYGRMVRGEDLDTALSNL